MKCYRWDAGKRNIIYFTILHNLWPILAYSAIEYQRPVLEYKLF